MAPSKEANDALGALGGALLASMMVPQLYKLWKTKRAQDLSLIFLFLYLTGTLLLFIYLYFEGATVAWICLAVEMGLLVLVICSKVYLDYVGPYSLRATRDESVAGGAANAKVTEAEDVGTEAPGEHFPAGMAEQGVAAAVAQEQEAGVEPGLPGLADRVRQRASYVR